MIRACTALPSSSPAAARPPTWRGLPTSFRPRHWPSSALAPANGPRSSPRPASSRASCFRAFSTDRSRSAGGRHRRRASGCGFGLCPKLAHVKSRRLGPAPSAHRPIARGPDLKQDGAAPMLVLIDNYDSFTYNLVHFLGELGARCEVYRNDKIAVADVLKLAPQGIVLSPGPC